MEEESLIQGHKNCLLKTEQQWKLEFIVILLKRTTQSPSSLVILSILVL